MKTLRMKKSTPGVNVIIIVFSLIFIIHAAVCLFPVLYSALSAFKDQSDFAGEFTFFPLGEWHIENFGRVFIEFKVQGDVYFETMLWNSVWMLVVRVFVNVCSSMILAYGVARFDFPGKNFLYSVIIFANTIPIIGAGPAAFKLENDLGMIDNPALIWLAWAGGFDFAFIILYGAFRSLGQEISEAAKIDGAGNLRIMFTIVIPQIFPSIVAIAITQATSAWNNYTTSMVSMREYPSLAYGLFLFNTDSNYLPDAKPVYFATAIIAAMPMVLLYGCNQKLILKNMTAGGLKG